MIYSPVFVLKYDHLHLSSDLINGTSTEKTSMRVDGMSHGPGRGNRTSGRLFAVIVAISAAAVASMKSAAQTVAPDRKSDLPEEEEDQDQKEDLQGVENQCGH